MVFDQLLHWDSSTGNCGKDPAYQRLLMNEEATILKH